MIPDTQINSEGEIIDEEEQPDVMVELELKNGKFEIKESPDSPDETMIPAHEIDPPMPESPLFPPSEPKRPPPKKRYAKKTKKCRRKLFESNTTSNSDSELSSKNYVPIPSEPNTPQTVKSENDKEESMDLMTEMFGPAENELRPTQVYNSWAEATVPFEEMMQIRDFIKRRPFDHKNVAQELYDIMMSGNFTVCESLEKKTGIKSWNMLKWQKDSLLILCTIIKVTIVMTRSLWRIRINL